MFPIQYLSSKFHTTVSQIKNNSMVFILFKGLHVLAQYPRTPSHISPRALFKILPHSVAKSTEISAHIPLSQNRTLSQLDVKRERLAGTT